MEKGIIIFDLNGVLINIGEYIEYFKEKGALEVIEKYKNNDLNAIYEFEKFLEEGIKERKIEITPTIDNLEEELERLNDYRKVVFSTCTEGAITSSLDLLNIGKYFLDVYSTHELNPALPNEKSTGAFEYILMKELDDYAIWRELFKSLLKDNPELNKEYDKYVKSNEEIDIRKDIKLFLAYIDDKISPLMNAEKSGVIKISTFLFQPEYSQNSANNFNRDNIKERSIKTITNISDILKYTP